MSEYKRNCPKCNKELFYTSKYYVTRTIKQQNFCKSCAHVNHPKKKIPIEERFWRYVLKSVGNGCWIWTGALRQGYGQISNKVAHRVSWEIHNGPIPQGFFVCHHCDNPPCVNPYHLFLGNAQDNTSDMIIKGRHHPKYRKNGQETLRRKTGAINKMHYKLYKRQYEKQRALGHKSFTVLGPIDLIEATKAFTKQYKREHGLYVRGPKTIITSLSA